MRGALGQGVGTLTAVLKKKSKSKSEFKTNNSVSRIKKERDEKGPLIDPGRLELVPNDDNAVGIVGMVGGVKVVARSVIVK